MKTGSLRQLHFSGFGNGTIPRPTPTPRSASSNGNKSELNPLLAMGHLLRDHQLIGEKLRALHLDESSYHGNLQVILSATRRMQEAITVMIKQCEV